jgi:hypothetical protein
MSVDLQDFVDRYISKHRSVSQLQLQVLSAEAYSVLVDWVRGIVLTNHANPWEYGPHIPLPAEKWAFKSDLGVGREAALRILKYFDIQPGRPKLQLRMQARLRSSRLQRLATEMIGTLDEAHELSGSAAPNFIAAMFEADSEHEFNDPRLQLAVCAHATACPVRCPVCPVPYALSRIPCLVCIRASSTPIRARASTTGLILTSTLHNAVAAISQPVDSTPPVR